MAIDGISTRGISIREALKAATERHGSVRRIGSGPNGWGYTTWSERHRAWWEPGQTESYAQAVRFRAASIAVSAALILRPDMADGYGEFRAEQIALSVNGSAVARLRHILREV